MGVGITVHARTSAESDSLKVINLQEVQVVSTRATAKTPMAFTNIGKAELKKVNFGQDIPYLLSMTPSTLTTSDAGAGIGYTTLRVRGTDGTRINITVNGIPMNDAESHNLFWVNMPDFSSSVKDMQVQRGAGTSTNGAGAFGASVNMQTEGAAMKPYAEFNGSYGSFNTHKETVKVGTGLLNNHWTFDARLSNIGTDGYIDRASVDLNSYYLQGGYFAENTSVKLIAFAGKEKTYHAWGYATKEEMEKFGRRYNPCGEMYTDADGNKHYYTDQTDNYLQKNYQLLLNHSFSTAWNLNVALHYTKGDGYYEEYKPGSSLVEYGLKPFNPDGTETNESDLVRQKKMDNKFGGGVFSLNYTGNRLTASLGGGLNQYRGNNFGKVTWVKNYIGNLSPEHEYYRNKSKKTDGNIYLKANYDLTSTLSAYADLQYRHIDYTIDGVNDKYDWNKNALRPLAVDKKFDFFNPKVGLNWNITPNHRLYASFSVAQKEPTRNNYTDGDPDSYPKAEKLLDYEAGYTFANPWLTAGANFYYMDYTDQLVLTGALNDIGEAEDMYNAVIKSAKDADIIIKAAAVADYRPSDVSDEKIKKKDGDMSIPLERTKDIIGTLGSNKRDGLFLCGFSMETEHMLDNSKVKLTKKNLDMIVANNVKVAGAGFGTDTNVVTVITKDAVEELPMMSKEEVADALLDRIMKARQ